MVISVALLLLAVLCGLFYQSVCYKRLCREPGTRGMLNWSLRIIKILNEGTQLSIAVFSGALKKINNKNN